ncbi:MAG: thioester domain-containing protein, partial [Clostridiales Family XIII bacterium]|nr:thioester domain-containing protein [Clostridiales Family XIII bacterium]
MITKKTKNKRPRRLALALAVCLICGQIAAVHAVPDSTMYTLVLQYNDAIQLTYAHGQGGEHWETTGDVPLGGAHINGKDGPLVLPQIYCADAEVPFHPYANGGRGGSSSEWIKGVLTDIVPNYVSVAPDQAPATLKAHWRQLEWVIVNGYQGTKESTDRMNGKFKLSDAGGALGPFGYDVAVTATKAVVWHFTNPDVKFLSTGFLARSGNEPDSPNGIKH